VDHVDCRESATSMAVCLISLVRFNDVVIVEDTSEESRSGSGNNAFRNASLNWSAYAYIDDNGHRTHL